MSALRRWEPFRSLMDMQGDLDRVFDEFFGHSLTRREDARPPAVDVSETADEVLVKAELPGVNKEDLQVEILPESLSLRAVTTAEKEEKERTYHRRERVWRRYERHIPLPAEVVTAEAKAALTDGVLEVRMPKTERSKETTPRKLPVE